MNNRNSILALFLCTTLFACSATHKEQIKKDASEVGKATKDATTAIGHATRDATRETGHFFRDLTKELTE
ncbi:hypothetical protein [Vibrio algarum]|uniref:Lipoprotein n=1 Tax=Vibrio algarum TaxID=3020714 RepID=A0ABT4YV54_9VIBR|nr:hypothetical protein [Vibrio sp. KJ40-1]MDB1125457.1 hypothetical protein [Vibrio sp. KJ40-1]